MAWRCDASGDDLRRTASLPSAASFTACGWLRLQALSAGASTFFSIAQSTTQLGLQFSSAGVLVLTSAADVSFPRSPAVGQWFFWACKCSGTGANLAAGYFRSLREGILTQAVGARSAITPDTLWFMNNASAEPTNGRIAGIKVWDAVLTDAEILRESYQLAPIRRHRLHLWAQENTGADLSGLGRTLTKTGTLTFEPGPPVPLFRNQPVILDHVSAGGGAAALAGNAAAQAGAAAQLTTAIPILGAMVVQASATGQLGTGIPLAGAAQAVASVFGNLNTAIPLAGAVAVVVTAQGAMTTAIRLSGDMLSQALAQAAMTTGIPLLGAAQAQVAMVGALTAPGGGFRGDMAALAQMNADLTIQIRLSAAAIVNAAMVGALGTGIPLAGAAQSVAAGAGSMGTQIPLLGAVVSISQATGVLTVQIRLSAAAAAQAIAAGALVTAIRLEGAAIAAVMGSGTLASFQLVPTPDGRTFRVPKEQRTLYVREDRSYRVPREQRTFRMPAGGVH